MSEETSAVRVLEELVRQAEQAGASDVHLQRVGRRAQVRFRLDGVMTPMQDISEDVAERVFGRIKFLARLKTYQESLPQDGRIDKANLGTTCDLRVATYPTVTGEKIVLRLFAIAIAGGVQDLGFAPVISQEITRFLLHTSGLMLLTGPAGSGKSTTIYAALRDLAGRGGRHIVTVEDPAEQVIPGVMQTEVNDGQGLTYAKAARHLLRQDPQVLVVGEIRDEETANIVVKAALTGHMVLATLHAGSCQAVFERLLNLCNDSYSVVTALELVVNQRLIRRRCSHCEGRGCSICLSTGYRGRMPLAESIRVDDALRSRVRSAGPEVVHPQYSLGEAARDVLRAGWSDEAEIQRVLGADILKALHEPRSDSH